MNGSSSTSLFGIQYLFQCCQEMTLFGLHDDSLDDVEQVDRNDRDQVDQMVMVGWRIMAMGYCSL